MVVWHCEIGKNLYCSNARLSVFLLVIERWIFKMVFVNLGLSIKKSADNNRKFLRVQHYKQEQGSTRSMLFLYYLHNAIIIFEVRYPLSLTKKKQIKVFE